MQHIKKVSLKLHSFNVIAFNVVLTLDLWNAKHLQEITAMLELPTGNHANWSLRYA